MLIPWGGSDFLVLAAPPDQEPDDQDEGSNGSNGGDDDARQSSITETGWTMGSAGIASCDKPTHLLSLRLAFEFDPPKIALSVDPGSAEELEVVDVSLV